MRCTPPTQGVPSGRPRAGSRVELCRPSHRPRERVRPPCHPALSMRLNFRPSKGFPSPQARRRRGRGALGRPGHVTRNTIVTRLGAEDRTDPGEVFVAVSATPSEGSRFLKRTCSGVDDSRGETVLRSNLYCFGKERSPAILGVDLGSSSELVFAIDHRFQLAAFRALEEPGGLRRGESRGQLAGR